MIKKIKVLFTVFSIMLVTACSGTIEREETLLTVQEEIECISDNTISIDPKVLENFEIPKENLTQEELRAYVGRLMLEVVRYPDTIDKYKDIFDEESIENFKKQEWYYTYPEEFYDWVLVNIDSIEEYDSNQKVEGGGAIDNQYGVWDLKLENIPKRKNINYTNYYSAHKEGLGKWAFCYEWVYEKSTGKISIDNCEFLMTLYGILGKNGEKEGTIYPFSEKGNFYIEGYLEDK